MSNNMTLKVISDILKQINDALEFGNISAAKKWIDPNDQPFEVNMEKEKQEDIDEFYKRAMEFFKLKSKLNDKKPSNFERNICNMHKFIHRLPEK